MRVGYAFRQRKGGQDDGSLDETAHWRQALTIYQQIGVPCAQRVREILHRHALTTSPGSA